MTLFWIISAAMIVAALAMIAPTLLRRYQAGADATGTLNVEIARERHAELVKQRDQGEISDEEFEQARRDLEMALAQDLETTETSAIAQKAGDGRGALIASAILIPLITIPVYLEIGSPQLIERGQAAVAAAPHGTGSGSGEMPPVGELAEQLRQRMEQNPDNAEGWFLLGRTYMRLQNYTQAVDAFERVVELLPNEAAGLLSLADALAMRDGRRVGERAVGLLERALELDPESVTALWLLGNAAADNGDTATALDYWQRAYPLLAGDPSMQAELGGMIRAAGGELPAKPVATLPPIMSAAPAPAPAAAPPAGDDAAGGAAIRVEVAVAPALIDRLEPGDTVFVLARAEAGPPMPLAVSRHRADELPLSVTLTDAMAMMPAMKLSGFPRVKVSARVSRSGQAGTQPGDLRAADRVVETANPPDSVQLLINEVVR